MVENITIIWGKCHKITVKNVWWRFMQRWTVICSCLSLLLQTINWSGIIYTTL